MANRKIAPDRRLVLFSASAFVLAGCGGLGLGPTDNNNVIYVLEPATVAAPGGRPATWALAIDLPDAIDAIDTRRIVLIKSDSTLDYYANAAWPDRLPVLVQAALVAAFQTSGRVPSVSRVQDALQADFELNTEIRDFTAHYSEPDGVPKVTVSLVTQMSTARGRRIVSSFTARQEVPASQNSTAAVVAAFSAALSAAIGQIVTWAIALPPPPPPPSP